MFTKNFKKLLINYSRVIRNYSSKSTILQYQNKMDQPDKPLFKVALSNRLSALVRPTNYKLLLNPDLKNGTFKGNVVISVNIDQEKSYINLHTKFLQITNIQVLKNGDKECRISKYLEVTQLEQLLIHFKHPISAGCYEINIDFNGDLTRNIVGFYSSRLNNNRNMVASKFQPTYARQAFPCFDEPDFKATFDITLVKPSDYIALSNMNEIEKVPFDEENKTEAVTFATSVPMSTYLACFVICDFDYIENDIDTQGVGKTFQLRSFALKHQMDKINFAQSIGKRATEFYIRYYQVPFPLPKLDMIAIPDYQSGATEHWGLITYRQTLFLIDEVSASVHNKISAANTIAHELAHMWFGNLVTLKWWDDLWLNEGFATYMQVKALDAIEPTWTMLELFLTKTMHPVLTTDAKVSSHPIVQTVETPDQITAIFDAISYNKGSSVLRMLEGFLGKENFRLAISQYLAKYRFGNTITQDLLSLMEPYFKKTNPDLNLTHIINTWTRQMGYPVLTVTRSEEPHTYVITQERFLLDPEAVYPRDSPYGYRWFIPITYKTNKKTHDDILWFPDTADSVKLVLKEGEHLLKINNDQVGYYRVNYPVYLWEKLISQLKVKAKQLSISDRAHLLEEVFALAKAERVPHELALNLTTYLNTETDFVPWQAASSIYQTLRDKLWNTDAISDLLKYFQELVTPLYNKFSWDKTPDSVTDRLLREKILMQATRSRVPHAVEKVRSLFLNWLNSHDTGNPVHIEPDLREFVYFNAMKQATVEEWEKLLEIYKKEDDPQEAAKLRSALAAPKDPDILKRFLQIAWDEKVIRGQDYFTVLIAIANSSPAGTMLVWDEIRSRWPEFVERFTLNSRYLGQLIPAVTYYFQSDLRLKEMEAFFEEYPEAGAGAVGRLSALETVRHNIRWQEKHQPQVAAWLKSYLYKKSAKTT